MLITGSYAAPSGGSGGGVIGGEAAAAGSGITAYIPDGDYANGILNLEVVPVAGTGPARATIATTTPVNSCAANQNTGTVVCTDNLNGIYLINGNTVSSTLTSSGVNTKTTSGGSCTTCAVLVDSGHNRAIISIANNINPTPASTPIPPGPGAYQVLNLANNTLSAPISAVGTHQIAESFGLKAGTNTILSANEQGFFDLIDFSNLAAPIAYSFVGAPLPPELDSTTVDSTGIMISGGEDSANLFLADLSQATFSPGSNPPTWNAPSQFQALPEFDPSFGYFRDGITAMAIAVGSNDAFLEDEFGVAGSGAGIGVVKLPTSGGVGTPAATDWVVAHMPTTPNNASWNMTDDPHGLTAARANLAITGNGVAAGSGLKGTGFLVNKERTYLGVIDLDALLAAPRAANDAHQLDPNYPALQNNLITYIPVNPSTQTSFIQNGDFNNGFGFFTTGTVVGSPQININTSPVTCLPQVPSQFGNPFASLNVPNGADGFFQQQVTVPNAAGQVVSFKSWGIISAVTVTVSVIPSSGPAQMIGSFIAPQIMNPGNTCSGLTPAIKTFSLNAFAGQTVTLRFEATSVGLNQAIANFDNLFVGTGS